MFSKIGWMALKIQDLTGTLYRLKVGNFKCCRCAKFSPCHWKTKIPPHLKPYSQMSTFNLFELKKCFRKSVEHLWRYRILAGTVYRLKVGNFKCCRCAKFSPWNCKSKISAHLKLSTQMPALNIFELKQSLRKLVEYLWWCRILAGTVYRFKVGNFKYCRCAKFSPCHCKSKYLRTLNFPPKCPPSTSSRWK